MFRTASSFSPPKNIQHQRGVALVYAIFIVIAVGGALAMMNQWQGSQSAMASSKLLRARALAAANAGIDWTIRRIQTAGNCPSASQSLSLTDGALSGFTVVATCSRSGPVTEGESTFYWYTLSARARSGTLGQPDFVSRQINVAIAQ